MTDTNDRTLLGLAVIAFAMDRESDPSRKGMLRFVLEGARDKHRITEKAVRDYMRLNAAEVEREWLARMAPKHLRPPAGTPS